MCLILVSKHLTYFFRKKPMTCISIISLNGTPYYKLKTFISISRENVKNELEIGCCMGVHIQYLIPLLLITHNLYRSYYPSVRGHGGSVHNVNQCGSTQGGLFFCFLNRIEKWLIVLCGIALLMDVQSVIWYSINEVMVLDS